MRGRHCRAIVTAPVRSRSLRPARNAACSTARRGSTAAAQLWPSSVGTRFATSASGRVNGQAWQLSPFWCAMFSMGYGPLILLLAGGCKKIPSFSCTYSGCILRHMATSNILEVASLGHSQLRGRPVSQARRFQASQTICLLPIFWPQSEQPCKALHLTPLHLMHPSPLQLPLGREAACSTALTTKKQYTQARLCL